MSGQLELLPIKDEFLGLFHEYEERKSLESIVVKDADLIEQICLEKEYIDRGVKSLEEWFKNQLSHLKLESSKLIAKQLIETSSFEWQEKLLSASKTE